MKSVSGLAHRFAAILSAATLTLMAPLVQAMPAGELVWEEADQFVSIVPRESADGVATSANQHPAQLEPQRISAALQGILLQAREQAPGTAQLLPLLQPQVAEQLAPYLSRALAQADARQDVLFAITTFYKSALIGKQKVSVAARAFYLNDRLHLVLGDVFRSTLPENFHSDQNRSRQIDRRLYPHVPGKRTQPRELDYRVVVDGKRVDFMRPEVGKVREDWLVLNMAVAPARRAAVATGAPAEIADPAVLDRRLARLKQLLDAGLLDQQSYQKLTEEAVRQELFR